MRKHRYLKLVADHYPLLTDKEVRQGWHFCIEYDGLLVGPGMELFGSCCGHSNKPKAASRRRRLKTFRRWKKVVSVWKEGAF